MNPRSDLLKPSPFTMIGLVFALAALVLFVLSIVAAAANWGFSLGGPCVLCILGGALFLLIGGNDQIS